MKHFKDQIGLKYKDFKFALTCDTMVEFKGVGLDKPKSLLEAKKWLLNYSGQEQFVHTGCCLLRLDGQALDKSWVTTTKIKFKKIFKIDVDQYLDENLKVLGKAGGYGIQDKKFNLIQSIQGSYTNIVGLTLESLRLELKKWELK